MVFWTVIRFSAEILKQIKLMTHQKCGQFIWFEMKCLWNSTNIEWKWYFGQNSYGKPLSCLSMAKQATIFMNFLYVAIPIILNHTCKRWRLDGVPFSPWLIFNLDYEFRNGKQHDFNYKLLWVISAIFIWFSAWSLVIHIVCVGRAHFRNKASTNSAANTQQTKWKYRAYGGESERKSAMIIIVGARWKFIVYFVINNNKMRAASYVPLAHHSNCVQLFACAWFTAV